MKDGVLDLDGIMVQLNNVPETLRKHMTAALNNCKDKGKIIFILVQVNLNFLTLILSRVESK